MLGSSCPLLRVAGRLYSPRDPGSESSGAGLSKKRVEAPRDPCSEIKGLACPRRFFGESARGGFFSEKAALSQIVIL